MFDGLVSEDGRVPFSVHVAESVEVVLQGLDGAVRLLEFCAHFVRGTFFSFRGSYWDVILRVLIPGFSFRCCVVRIFSCSFLCVRFQSLHGPQWSGCSCCGGERFARFVFVSFSDCQ